MKSYIIRKKVGKNYHYFSKGVRVTDDSAIERINALAIPPAWKRVQIARAASAKVQAVGVDSAGRQQSIYSQKYRLSQEKLKFNRILRFAAKLPKLRKQLDKDISRKRLSKRKVLACIVKLIDQSYFRVGNETYAKQNQTYGITTLRSKHLNITQNEVTFDFIGKSGKKHVKKVKDSELVAIIKQLDELPGYEIFRYQDAKGNMHDLHSKDVNAYIKKHMGGEFTAKDFRTWGGTLLTTAAILEQNLEENATITARKKALVAIVRQVAKRLGNTPAVAKSSYIDPRILTAYDDGTTFQSLKLTMKNMRPRKYMTVEEQCVLKNTCLKP